MGRRVRLFDRVVADPEEALALYEALLLPRLIEEKMLRLIRQGRLAKWFSGYGQEAIAVGCAWALRKDDYILPMHRNLGVWTTRGLPLDRLMCQLMGKTGGYTRGRDRTFHFGRLEQRVVGMISHLAAMLPVACGLGLAAQLDGMDVVALAFIGEGATREGDFHEALNLAAVWKLPVVFVVENNGYGLSTPAETILAARSFSAAGAAYGMPGRKVDGNHVLHVIESVRAAADRARSGEGPTLLEMETFRIRGHEEASGTRYVPDELIEAWGRKDPVARFERILKKEKVLSEEVRRAIRSRLEAAIEEAAAYGLNQPVEASTPERETSDLFALPAPVPPPSVPGPTATVRFIDAVSDGLRQAMREDARVVLMGQDIAEYGGVFKVTEGFLDAFGAERVRNTPIIESGAIGAALGLALAGYKPVVELQYADFIACGFNQIVNNLATTHYRWGAPVNVTLRAPFGGHIGAGPFHSQSMEAWFCHVPGLKVVVPATPADARGLLLASIDDPNPVLFFEHKLLYRSVKGEAPVDAVRVPIGTAAVRREGTDATVVTYGLGVHWALEEAASLAEAGYELEVIDLRTLIPWDRETVLASLKKTNRVLIVHEASRSGGFGAELCAELAEVAFEYLDAPPVRVAGLDLPIPFSKSLEQDIHSARPRLKPALEALLAY